MSLQDFMFLCITFAVIVIIFEFFCWNRRLRGRIEFLEMQIKDKVPDWKLASTDRKLNSLVRDVDAIKTHLGVQTTVVREHVVVVKSTGTTNNG